MVGFYAVGVLKDGSRTFVAMGRKEVESIRDGSRGYQAARKYKKESIWDTDFVAMGLKTAIRRICKFLPKSPELATALAMDEKAQAGQGQNLNLNDVIDGSYAPVIIDEDTGEITKDVITEKATPNVTDGKPKAAKVTTKLEKLDKVVAALRSASTVEALDEIYIRAEVDLEDAELEVALREYRKCKDAISRTRQPGLITLTGASFPSGEWCPLFYVLSKEKYHVEQSAVNRSSWKRPGNSLHPGERSSRNCFPGNFRIMEGQEWRETGENRVAQPRVLSPPCRSGW